MSYFEKIKFLLIAANLVNLLIMWINYLPLILQMNLI